MGLDAILHSGATDGARRKELLVIDDVGLVRVLHVPLATVALTNVRAGAGSRGGHFS